MARPFNAWAFLQARGFLRNYSTYRTWTQHWDVIGQLGKLLSLGKKEDRTGWVGDITESDKKVYRGAWQTMLYECEPLEMVASVASIRKMLAYLDQPKPQYDHYWSMGKELEGRLLDELQNRQFLSLSFKETELYTQPRKGWEVIIDRLPDTIGDIEEAQKCFALSRYSAAVFHSLQIVEFGLIELGQAIGVSDPKSGWTATTKALKKIIDTDYRALTPLQQKHRDFFEQVHGTVEALKNAWRNKISHAQGRLTLLPGDFSPEVAEEIILATRSFMRRLATDSPLASAEGQSS